MNEITIGGYRPGAIGKVVELHGTYYSRHWNFGIQFEAMVAAQMSEFHNRFNPATDGFWVAMDGERIIASIAIDGSCHHTEGARLRWFIADEAYAGAGLGNLLMNEAINFCRRNGFKRVYLRTIVGLLAARHLYDKFGFKLVEEHPSNTFGAPATEQLFELLLAD
ncbi:MAG: GNAT family N-acetyltransferase [Blastocatellia bacterium]